jgi:hypothetical protein
MIEEAVVSEASFDDEQIADAEDAARGPDDVDDDEPAC